MASLLNGKSLRRPGVIISVLLAPLLLWAAWDRLLDLKNRPITVTGTIQAKEIPVGSKVGGRLARVLVQEGQMVTRGQVLVEFEEPELEAKKQQLEATIAEYKDQLLELRNGPRQAEIERARAAAGQALANFQMLERGYRSEEISKAKAQRMEAERNLSLLETGYRPEEVAQAKDSMDQARVQHEWAIRDWHRYQDLAEVGAVSKREAEDLKTKMDAAHEAYEAAAENYKKMRAGPRVDEIRAARARLSFARHQEEMMLRGPRKEEIEVARQQYLQSQAALKLLEQGTRFEQIARAEDQLRHAQANLAELDSQLKEREVASPADAEVSVMDLHAGEIVPANNTVATLTRLDMVWTRVYLPERELSRVRIGQEVTVKVDAYPNRKFPGKIVQIPGVAEFTPRNVQTPEERSAQVFGLKVNIDNKDLLLRGGMNADVILPPVEGPWARLARGFQ